MNIRKLFTRNGVKKCTNHEPKPSHEQVLRDMRPADRYTRKNGGLVRIEAKPPSRRDRIREFGKDAGRTY